MHAALIQVANVILSQNPPPSRTVGPNQEAWIYYYGESNSSFVAFISNNNTADEVSVTLFGKQYVYSKLLFNILYYST